MSRTLVAPHSVPPAAAERPARAGGGPPAPRGPATLLDLVPAGEWATTDGLRAYYSLVTAAGADLATLHGWLAALAGQGRLECERPPAGQGPDDVALLRWRRA